MTTTITLPEYLARQLQRRAAVEHRSAESLAIEYLAERLTEDAARQVDPPPAPVEDDAELLALVARVKALPPNPASIIPAKGNLAEVLRALEAVEIPGYDLDAELAALDAAEQALQTIDRANDLAEGRE